MASVERALEIAIQAHFGQFDLAGEPYILHVVRVMAGSPKGDAQIVAALHDVVEDSDWTLDELCGEFVSHIVAAVDAITKRDSEPYSEYLARVSANPLARAVKLADLKDNEDLSRLPKVTERDCERARKYNDARMFLSAHPTGQD